MIGLRSTHRLADLLKAVLEGTTYEIEYMRQRAEALLGTAIDRVAEGRIVEEWVDYNPLVILHTIGAKSGELREIPLVTLVEGDDLYVFASKGGAPTNPDWYYNLKANPEITVEYGTETFTATVTWPTGQPTGTIVFLLDGSPAAGPLDLAPDLARRLRDRGQGHAAPCRCVDVVVADDGQVAPGHPAAGLGRAQGAQRKQVVRGEQRVRVGLVQQPPGLGRAPRLGPLAAPDRDQPGRYRLARCAQDPAVVGIVSGAPGRVIVATFAIR